MLGESGGKQRPAKSSGVLDLLVHHYSIMLGESGGEQRPTESGGVFDLLVSIIIP